MSQRSTGRVDYRLLERLATRVAQGSKPLAEAVSELAATGTNTPAPQRSADPDWAVLLERLADANRPTQLDVHLPPPPRIRRVERDAEGNIARIIEENA